MGVPPSPRERLGGHRNSPRPGTVRAGGGQRGGLRLNISSLVWGERQGAPQMGCRPPQPVKCSQRRVRIRAVLGSEPKQGKPRDAFGDNELNTHVPHRVLSSAARRVPDSQPPLWSPGAFVRTSGAELSCRRERRGRACGPPRWTGLGGQSRRPAARETSAGIRGDSASCSPSQAPDSAPVPETISRELRPS